MTTETITAIPGSERTDPVLDRLLDGELDYDPVTNGGFINHLPMALVAARRLGATDDELEESFRRTTSGDWLVHRGRPDWLGPESLDVAERGATTVIAEQLPTLVRAPGSQLFHAPIRLELAVDAAHAGQIANSLHNWSEHASPLEPAPQPAGSRSYAEVLAILHRDYDGARAEPSDPAFRRVFDTLEVTDGLLDDVARAVAAAHATDDNFWTLHLTTGTRAMRAVAPMVDPATRTELAVRTAHAVALLWLGTGDPSMPDDASLDAHRADAPDAWDEIGRRAIGTHDPHVMKLSYACRLEFETTGDKIYPWLAARQAGLL